MHNLGHEIPYLYDGNERFYRVYSNTSQGQRRMVHVPSKNGGGRALSPYDMLGLRGVSVGDLSGSHAQPVLLHWGGIDIDWEDNENKWGPDALAKDVCQMIPDAMVRTSKSGKGLHVFFKLAMARPFPSVQEAAEAARGITLPVKTHLENEGVACCVSGLPNFWVWSEGGLQRTLQWGKPVVVEAFTPAPARVAGSYSGSVPLGPRARKLVDALGVEPTKQTNVNIGKVKRSLNTVGLDFETRSKCRPEHEHEINGFIQFDDFHVRIFSNPDQKCVLILPLEC